MLPGDPHAAASQAHLPHFCLGLPCPVLSPLAGVAMYGQHSPLLSSQPFLDRAGARLDIGSSTRPGPSRREGVTLGVRCTDELWLASASSERGCLAKVRVMPQGRVQSQSEHATPGASCLSTGVARRVIFILFHTPEFFHQCSIHSRSPLW